MIIGALLFIVIWLGVVALIIASMWKVFTKAGQPGWASIVPIYNAIVMCEIAKKPTWWVAMIYLVPIANIVFAIMMLNGVSKNFGKDEGYTAGLVFLPFVFWPMLAFGDAKYVDSVQPATADLLDA